MAELVATYPLGGYDATIGGVRIEELVGHGIVSAAVPRGGDAAFDRALREVFSAERPVVGRSEMAEGGVRLAVLGPDRLWLLIPAAADDAMGLAWDRLGTAAYVTELSDGWVALRLGGGAAALRGALARLCMLDLGDPAFPDGAATRTLMAHLGVVLVREAESYTILTARSSALSLLGAIEAAARNTAPAGQDR